MLTNYWERIFLMLDQYQPLTLSYKLFRKICTGSAILTEFV